MSSGFFFLLIGGVLLVVALLLFVPIHRPRANRPVEHGIVFRADPRYWYGFFYYNPDDPDVFVPKRYSIGWTINFGRPAGKLFAIVMLILLLLPLVMMFIPGLNHATGCHTLGCTP